MFPAVFEHLSQGAQLVTHRRNLRIGVLVNEAGEVDIDSHFLSARALNASIGLPSLSVAGGSACCSVSSDLAASLRALQVTTGGYSRWRWHCKGTSRLCAKHCPDGPVQWVRLLPMLLATYDMASFHLLFGPIAVF